MRATNDVKALPRAIDRRALPRGAIVCLQQLLDASEFALQTRSDRWDFAVELAELQHLGVSLAELRLVVELGYVDHGVEISVPDDRCRRFAIKKGLVFWDRTCFVLTCEGKQFVRRLLAQIPVCELPQALAPRRPSGLSTPVWDSQLRELRIGGALVKEYRWHAINQEMVLSAFQEEGWPAVILDPLPPRADQDPKRRLHDTIKCLNRNHVNDLIRFHGDGTGEGVIWKSSADALAGV